jgi:hypothetical protein
MNNWNSAVDERNFSRFVLGSIVYLAVRRSLVGHAADRTVKILHVACRLVFQKIVERNAWNT